MDADIARIAHLLKSERFYRDTAQWQLCRLCFHPDASKTYINVSWLVDSSFIVSAVDNSLSFEGKQEKRVTGGIMPDGT